MNVRAQGQLGYFTVYTVTVGNSEFELSTFGGQLRSWSKGGIPILFANAEKAIADGTAAYRGGAPICFPYFGKGNLLPSPPITPQHGRARTSIWEAEVQESAIVLRTEQPAPEGFGPTTLACELTYTFREDGVRIAAKISNLGDNPSPFQLAVHSYWDCDQPPEAIVTHLGNRFMNNLAGLAEDQDPTPNKPHLPPVDRVYPDSGDAVELFTERHQIAISTENCAGSVLWNPGADHGLADLGSIDFVCVESGRITPSQTLAPGESSELQIDYRVTLK